MTNLDKFHAHLDNCKECEERVLFSRCVVGGLLLKVAALNPYDEATD